MRKEKNIYPKIYDFDNLYSAYLNARKGKRFRDDVLQFTNNLEENLIDIQNELIWKTYQVGEYHRFVITDPKKRLIMALRFRDRVVQWAIYSQLYPIFDKQFIYDSYGCRNGKGTLPAVKRLQYWLRQVDRKEDNYYYLKVDVSKFFYSVNHKILIDILERTIADKDTMELLKTIISSENSDVGLPQGFISDTYPVEGAGDVTGLPIGNLTSQMFANIYLNELDQYCKHRLKTHYYIRYMDDIIILDKDKKHLHRIKEKIERFLNTKLGLCLNEKTAIRPVGMGIEFVGYRVWSTHIKIRKKSVIKMKQRLKEIKYLYGEGLIDYDEVKSTLASYFGLMKNCNSFYLRKKLSDTLVFKRKEKSNEDN